MPEGKVWPAHPKPLPDELLSSWFVRVAEANAIKLQTLSWMLFGYGMSPWHRDIDRMAPNWLLKVLCAHTGVGYWDAYHTTLNTYRTRLFAKRRTSGSLRWLLPIISHGAARHGFGMQFCPACLAQDVEPYFRKQWRLALFTYCPLHGCVVYDACPACSAPIAYFRHDFGKEISQTKSVACCWSCGFDFREAEQKAAQFQAEELHEIFDRMLRSLAGPVVEAGVFDLGFFAVLHQLCRVMGMQQNHGKLLTYVANQLGMEIEPTELGWRSFEHLRREERHQWLLCGLWLMADLDTRLAAAWESKAVRYNQMLKDFDDAPKWYQRQVANFSNWRRS